MRGLRLGTFRSMKNSMNRWNLFVTLTAFLCLGAVHILSAQDQLTIDATKQPAPPARGGGPWFGSATPGHSPDLPIRLTLTVPAGALLPNGVPPPNGSTFMDFVITNIGADAIRLPISVNQKMAHTDVLTLWYSSDAIKAMYGKDQSGRLFKMGIIPTSAELYGNSDDADSFYVLAPSKSILIHASSRAVLLSGKHSFTAHAELLRLSGGRPELIGTASAETVKLTLLLMKPSPQ